MWEVVEEREEGIYIILIVRRPPCVCVWEWGAVCLVIVWLGVRKRFKALQSALKGYKALDLKTDPIFFSMHIYSLR